jgi:HEAT repeat protein
MVAAQTLGSLGRAAQPAFPRLVPLLGAAQPDIREAAVAAMGSLELEAEVIRHHIAKALRDEKPEVRRAASRAVQRLGPRGAILIPDIIMLADRKENVRSTERLLRRFERNGPDPRSLPELVKLLEHKQSSVRLLAIKYLGLAGRSASDAIPALERMREDPDAEVRRQAQAACERIKNRPVSADQASRTASPTTLRPR